MTRTMYDAGWPPPVPPATDAVAFYILPRDGDPAHTWFPTPQQDRPLRLPVTVNSFGGDGVKVARDCKAWALLNGMPTGTCFALDLETLVDAAFVSSFDAELLPWLCLAYGSTSTLFRNPRTSGGRWAATLDGREVMFPGADATQWRGDTGDGVDLSIVGDHVRLWDTRAPVPPVSSDLLEMMGVL